MPDFHVGTLSKEALIAVQKGALQEEESSEPRATFLHSRHWTKAPLLRKISISSDTRVFTFGLEHSKQILGLPTGKHLMMKTNDPFSKNNEAVIRAYTPLSLGTKEGTMDILIKIYPETTSRPGGKMTMALDRLPIGSTVDFKGPTGRFEYLGGGTVLINEDRRQINSFRMICGGSGITPIFQVLRAVMQDAEDPTKCIVLAGNRREEDILCRAEMDAFAAGPGGKLTVVHTLSRPTDTWTGGRGHVSEKLIREWAMPDDKSMVLVCGPESMEHSARKILLDLGWQETNMHFF